MRLRHDENRPFISSDFPEIAHDAGGQAADAALQDHMCEWDGVANCDPDLVDKLVNDRAIALHHVARDFFIALVGGVGNDLPAVDLGQARRLINRGVVVAFNPNDLRTESRDGLFALDADILMKNDDAAYAGALCRSRQGSTVVAVRGTDYHQILQCGRIAPRQHVLGVQAWDTSHDEPYKRYRRTERFEATQWRPYRLVLHPDFSDAELSRLIWQGPQGCRPAIESRPGGEPAPTLLGLVDTHHRTQIVRVRRACRFGVFYQHGFLCM